VGLVSPRRSPAGWSGSDAASVHAPGARLLRVARPPRESWPFDAERPDEAARRHAARQEGVGWPHLRAARPAVASRRLEKKPCTTRTDGTDARCLRGIAWKLNTMRRICALRGPKPHTVRKERFVSVAHGPLERWLDDEPAGRGRKAGYSRARPVEPEGEDRRRVRGARGRCAAIVINPGAFGHYAWAIADAFETFAGGEGRAPRVETPKAPAREWAPALGVRPPSYRTTVAGSAVR